jgi:neutral ceramidase
VLIGAVLLSVVVVSPSAAGGEKSLLPHSNSGRRVEAASPASSLRAGAGTVVLPLPAGVPLAGYGSWSRRRLVPDLLGRSPHTFWFKAADGIRDPIMARALVVETPAHRLLWVSVDLIAVDASLVTDLTARLRAAGFEYSAIMVSASHTHSGPGAFIDSALFGALVMDRFDASVRRALLDGVLQAATQAEHAKAPAQLGTRSESGPPVLRSRLHLAVDSEIALVKLVRPNGAPVALVWNFAIHGTMLGPRNLRLSGDVMGVASRALERTLGMPVLFVNGAVADVSPAAHGERAVSDVGQQLADAVSMAAAAVTPRDGAALAVAYGAVELGAPFMSLRNCLGRWMPRFVRVPLSAALPPSATLVAAALGDAAWVAVPGELQARLGTQLKEAGRRHFALPFVAGLSNGYLGYFLTREDYQRPGYIECASLYGEGSGERITAEAIALLDQLGTQRSRGRVGASGTRRAVRRSVTAPGLLSSEVGAQGVRAASDQSVASRRASADFFRAAELRWRIPLVTARSSSRMASATDSRALVSLPASAVRAVFTDVRTLDRSVRFRCRRTSVWRTALIADFVLATRGFLPGWGSIARP